MNHRSKLTKIAVAAALTASLGLAGCSALGGASAAYLEADNADRAGQIASALDSIAEKIGADALITDMSVLENSTTVSAIDSAAKDELNSWRVLNGKMEESVPVDYGDDVEALQENAFPLKDVDPSVIAKLIDEAPGMSGFDDLTVTAVSLSYPLVAFGEEDWKPQYKVSLDGERHDETLTFELDGSLVKE